jgi:hypothetical protein
MRVTQILLPLLAALATGACARQQASYYVIDPATQQPVAVAQGYALPARPQYAQEQYQQAPAPSGNRGLFSSPQIAATSYAPAPYGQQVYLPPVAQPQQPPSGRGLFNTFAESRATPLYPQTAYAQQGYAPAPAAQPVYAPQTYTQPGYAPRGQAGQPAAPQYRPQQYGTGGPYIAAAQSNPFAQARWY